MSVGPEILQYAVDAGCRVEEVDGPTGRLEPLHRKRVGERTHEQRPDSTNRCDFVRQQAWPCLVAKYQKHDPYTTTTTKLIDGSGRRLCARIHK